MKTGSLRAGALAIAAALLVSSVPALAQTTDAPAPPPPPDANAAPAPGDADPDIEPEAVAAVKRLVTTLTSAQKMSFTADESYDAIQDDGEAIEFGRVTTTTIVRPNKVASDVVERRGRHLRLFWDGTTVVVYDETRQAFATTPRSGDLDSLLDFLRDRVGFKIPLGDLFATDLGKLLVDNVVAARLVDQQTVGGALTDHVALRFREGVDVQIWIRTKDSLPQRIVINYFTAEGRPQFRADFRDWDLTPRAPASMFTFRPAKGVRMIPFAVSRRPRGASAEEAAQ